MIEDLELKNILSESIQSNQLNLNQAINLSKKIINGVNVKYIDPFSLKPNSKGKFGLGIPTGSIRRKNKTINDIDILITDIILPEKFEKLSEFVEFIERGKDKLSFYYLPDRQIRVDIRFLKDLRSFGAMLLRTTGPWDYNRNLSKIAKDQGLLLNEYGVFKNNKYIAGETEQDVYQAIKTSKFPKGKKWTPPELRGKE